jgi:hypothetical protein
MSHTARIPNLFASIVIGAIATMVMAAPHQAHAQNLVQNPDFFNGLTGYQTSGDVTATNFLGGPSNTENPEGTNSAEGVGPGAGDTSSPAVLMQALTTTPNTMYMVTFSYAVEPGVTDSLTVTFGSTSETFTTSTSDGSTPFDVISFMARSNSQGATDLTFTGNEGAFAVSDLDVESGPAPVTGGGVLSFGIVLSGLAFRHMRRRGLAAEIGG